MVAESSVERNGEAMGSRPPIAPPTVKIKWADHLNSSWLNETCQSLAHRDSANVLYERLIENKVRT